MDQYAEHITKSTLIRDILTVSPDAASLFARYGIHCTSCAFNVSETLGEGMQRHRLSKETIEDLLNDLHILVQELPKKPLTIAITKDAAILLKNITSKSGLPSLCAIIVNEEQQLTLEVCPDTPDHPVFFHPDMPEVRIFVSPLLLLHVGGAELSVKDGRLRIDLPQHLCCEKKSVCSCAIAHANG